MEFLLAAFTIFCWGTLPAVTKLTLTAVSNVQVLFISSLLAVGCLLPALALTGRLRCFCALSRRDWAQLAGLGFLGNFLYSAFYYASLRVLPSADACIINYLWPILAAFWAGAILRERLAPAQWLAMGLSFAGVVVISAGGGPGGLSPAGVLSGVAGACCYGAFNVLNKKKGLDQMMCTAVYFAVTALCSGLVLPAAGGLAPMSPRAWLGMLWLGVVIDALATFAWGAALLRGRVGVLSNLAYLTPAAAMAVSFFALHEPIRLYALGGMALILTGCLVQLTAKKRPAAGRGKRA